MPGDERPRVEAVLAVVVVDDVDVVRVQRVVAPVVLLQPLPWRMRADAAGVFVFCVCVRVRVCVYILCLCLQRIYHIPSRKAYSTAMHDAMGVVITLHRR